MAPPGDCLRLGALTAARPTSRPVRRALSAVEATGGPSVRLRPPPQWLLTAARWKYPALDIPLAKGLSTHCLRTFVDAVSSVPKAIRKQIPFQHGTRSLLSWSPSQDVKGLSLITIVVNATKDEKMCRGQTVMGYRW